MTRYQPYALVCVLMILFFSRTSAEIVKVEVQWQPETCPMNCAQLLASQFQKIPGIAQIIMNQPGGHVELRWKPNFPFAYQQVKSAMQAAGPGIQDIRVKVRGTVHFDQQTASLVSLGDNTTFYLLGQVQANPNQLSVYYNVESHPLSQEILTQLVDGAKKNQIAVIEGPLFEPWRYPYMWLMIDKLQFVDSTGTNGEQP
jgi:hypothetical protein